MVEESAIFHLHRHRVQRFVLRREARSPEADLAAVVQVDQAAVKSNGATKLNRTATRLANKG
jgi:hypothetical protein